MNPPALLVVTLALGVIAGAKPPPAWIQTSTGRHRLAYSSFCWKSKRVAVCADAGAPRCGDGHTPTIRVRRGELVRFELGFLPKSVSVDFGTGRSEGLASSRSPHWRVDRAGALTLFADAGVRGDASYTACIVFRS
jgi:hypothetical protein